ncbi:hypothetical protein MMPV_005422 [Pyropia vietnamensis]
MKTLLSPRRPPPSATAAAAARLAASVAAAAAGVTAVTTAVLWAAATVGGWVRVSEAGGIARVTVGGARGGGGAAEVGGGVAVGVAATAAAAARAAAAAAGVPSALPPLSVPTAAAVAAPDGVPPPPAAANWAGGMATASAAAAAAATGDPSPAAWAACVAAAAAPQWLVGYGLPDGWSLLYPTSNSTAAAAAASATSGGARGSGGGVDPIVVAGSMLRVAAAAAAAASPETVGLSWTTAALYGRPARGTEEPHYILLADGAWPADAYPLIDADAGLDRGDRGAVVGSGRNRGSGGGGGGGRASTSGSGHPSLPPARISVLARPSNGVTEVPGTPGGGATPPSCVVGVLHGRPRPPGGRPGYGFRGGGKPPPATAGDAFGAAGLANEVHLLLPLPPPVVGAAAAAATAAGAVQALGGGSMGGSASGVGGGNLLGKGRTQPPCVGQRHRERLAAVVTAFGRLVLEPPAGAPALALLLAASRGRGSLSAADVAASAAEVAVVVEEAVAAAVAAVLVTPPRPPPRAGLAATSVAASTAAGAAAAASPRWTEVTATSFVHNAIRLVEPPPADAAAAVRGSGNGKDGGGGNGQAAAIRWASRLVPPTEVLLVLDADVRMAGGWQVIDRCVRAAVLDGQAVFPVVAASFPLPSVISAAAGTPNGSLAAEGDSKGGQRWGSGWLTRSYAVMCARRYDYDEMLEWGRPQGLFRGWGPGTSCGGGGRECRGCGCEGGGPLKTNGSW